MTFAYIAQGEAKYDDLSVIFAQAVSDVIILSSDDEELPNATGKDFVLVDEELPNAPVEPEYVVVDEMMIEQPKNTMAIVPYQPPVEAIPLQAIPTLDAIDISSSSTQTELLNWWEYVDFTSDDEGSTATDASTARSLNFATSTSRGFRERFSRCKTSMSPVKSGIHLSSTASNSPLAKPPSK